jgi:hypothetical protein
MRRVPTEAMTAGGDEAKRAVRATTIMKKIDVARSRSTMELMSSEVAPKANSIELENIAVGHCDGYMCDRWPSSRQDSRSG